jgi:hypothetical protein
MYLPSSALLPRNSMDAPSVFEVQKRRAAVDRINFAAFIAKQTVACPPDPWAFRAVGDNIAQDVGQSETQSINSWLNPMVSGTPLTADSIPGNSLADPPVNSPLVVVTPVTAKAIRDAITRAPKAIPVALSQQQVGSCDLTIPIPSTTPRPQVVKSMVMPQPAPTLPPKPISPGTPSVSQMQGPVNPCPPGGTFMGSYTGVNPNCIYGYGTAARGPQGRQAFASIVSRGVGDAPPWGNAIDQSQSIVKPGPVLPPWAAFLFAGIGLFALARKG